MRRLVVIVAIVLVGVAFVVSRSPSPPLDRALAILADDGRFTTANRAAEAVAEASELVIEDSGACDTAEPTCAVKLEAAAYLQVLVVGMVRCTAPGRFDARTSARQYLEAVRDGARPMPPGLPECAHATSSS